MRIYTASLVIGLALLTSCGGDGDDKPAAPESSSEVMDVTSGRPLSEFEGSPTYEWRKMLVDTHDELLEKMQGVASHLEEKDLSDVLNTCQAVTDGVSPKKVFEQAVARFSGGPDEQINAAQAEALVGLSQDYACPQ